ncbi:MAG: hypothetical protein JWM41_3355 [Gemmatimonadetes bacterium]|nr:hypothetical protein [Gemmatimonadota bacterium]
MAAVGYWATPGDRARVIVDERGTEWEVYDESTWSIELALEWDFLPQTENPGLIFASRDGRRRVWPCPVGWQKLSDAELLALLTAAKTSV